MLKHRETGLLPRAILWLFCLGGFFFLSYGLANHITSLRQDVGQVVFDWETKIPLWSWMIIPYWSIDLLYGIAFLLVSTKKELTTLAIRLLLAQLICISVFLLFPLQFTFIRPPQDGLFGWLFDLLMGFDKPFNQAPSLHITLLVVLWACYANYINKYRGRLAHWILNGWFFLIGLSVLTTWQHHFIDVPTGIIAGCLSIWLKPSHTLSPMNINQPPKQWRWALCYLLASLICGITALWIGGLALWLCWLSLSLLLVALNYSFIGAKGFQKQPNGRFYLPVLLLYLPYIIIMWLNSRIWTRKNNSVDLVIEKVYLGRIPDKNILNTFAFNSIVDLCAEIPIAHYDCHYTLIPVLDLTPLSIKECEHVATVIETNNQQGSVLVCCALGYSRSATSIIAWLLKSKRANSITQAISIVRKARPDIVVSQKQQAILQQWITSNNE